jgi:hypothetical protein
MPDTKPEPGAACSPDLKNGLIEAGPGWSILQ